MSQSQNSSCSSSPLFPSSCPHCVDEARSKSNPDATDTKFSFVSESNLVIDPYRELAVKSDKNNWLPELGKADKQLKELIAPLKEWEPLMNIAQQNVSTHLRNVAQAQPVSDIPGDVRQTSAFSASIGPELPGSPRLTACALRDAPEEDVVEAIYRMDSIGLPLPVTWARGFPEEPSANPSMLGSNEISNHRLVYNDKNDKVEYFPFNLGLVEAGDRHEEDKRNAMSDNCEECDSQGPTPSALSEDTSSPTSRGTSPTTPSDAHDDKAAVSKRRIDKGKQRAAPQPPSPKDHAIPTRSSRKRKAELEDDVTESNKEEVPQKSITAQSEGVSGDEKKSTRKRTATKDKSVKRPGDLLSAEFLRYRFDIEGASNDTHTCPFPPSTALQKGICNAVFDQKAIRRHISNHVNAFKNKHPGQLLPCPFGGDDCTWDEKEPTDHVDPNSGLARHVVQVHLNTDELVCVCGNTICRGDRGHIARHLRTDEHKAKLEEKMDPNLRYYPEIDDEELLEEEREWLEQKTIQGVEDDNRGEGSSSRPAKRHRAK